MKLFHRRSSDTPAKTVYDLSRYTPVLKCSICTGEQVAGFRDETTGAITEVGLIRGAKELQAFRDQYGITGEIEKIY